MIFLLVLIFDLIVLVLWMRYKENNGQKIPWYVGWIVPSDIIIVSLIVISTIAVTTKFAFDTFPLKEKRTEREMIAIKKAILKYKHDINEFPHSINELIGRNPLRQDWKLDYWNSEYRLTYQNEEIVKVSSAGTDKIFDTKDDLSVKLKD